MMTNCGCREISRTPIEFKIQECPQVHINCGPLLPNTNDSDWDILQKKIISDFKKIVKLLECGILPDIEILLEEISLIFMNSCGYNITKKMYSTDIEDDYFLRHNNFLSEFATLEEKDLVLLNLGIYEKVRDMVTKQEVDTIIDNTTTEINTEINNIVEEFNKNLDTKIGYVAHIGKWYYGFATYRHCGQWMETQDDNLVLGKWIAGDYVPIEFTIIFNTNENADPVEPKTVMDGFAFTFPEPTWNNDPTLHFVGWYTNQLFTGTYYNVGDKLVPTYHMNFYAKWVRDPRTITFYPNYGDNTPIVINCYQGDLITLTNEGIVIGENDSRQINITRTGYHFKTYRWNTDSNGNGTNYNPNDTLIIENNVILYAQWEINTYTVTFNFNYPTDPNIPSNITRGFINYGTPVNENFFELSDYVTNDGKIIKEWNISPDGLGSNPTTITLNITFYALWEYGYRYKLATSIPIEEPNWDVSNTQQTKLEELNGWNNWVNQNNQYIIVPKQIGKSIITDYIDILDLFNQSIIGDFEIIDSNVENIIVIKLNGFSPLDNSDNNAKLIIKI